MAEINDVKTTATHVCKSFEELVKKHIPAAGIIFDNDFSYETGLKLLMDKHNFNESQVKNLEVFIYNRTIMEKSELGMGNRTTSLTGKVNVDGELISYDVIQGEFDINFMYTSQDIRNVEKFEVAYSQNQTIAKEKALLFNYGKELGEFTYYLTPQALTDYIIKSDGASYNAILGSMRARGFFFTFAGSKKAIAKMNLRVFLMANPLENSELLYQLSFPNINI